MSSNVWASGAWGISLQEIFKDHFDFLNEVYEVIRAFECGDSYPERFYDDCGDFISHFAFLEDCKCSTDAVMRLYGEQLIKHMPYIDTLIALGAHFSIVDWEASEYEGNIIFGWGIYGLPIKMGTVGIPDDFLQNASMYTWVYFA